MNAFVFLKAYPLVHPDDYSHVGPITQEGSTFKNDITKILSSQKKALQIKFDILNRENLKAIKQYGCRVLHLASDQTDPDYLCAEGKYGILDQIYFDSPYEEYFSESEENNELQELLFTSEDRMNLDVVVLAFTESQKLAQALTKNGVKHVIYFDFTDEFLDDYCTYDLSIDVTQELITAFCKAFYKHLIKCKSIIESMEHGRRVFTQRLKELEKLDLPKIDLHMIGDGPMLLPEDTYHNECLFGTDDVSSVDLEEGSVIDISRASGPTNVSRLLKPTTGRRVEMHNLCKSISENKIVALYGPVGVGKTHLALASSYYLY